MVRAVERTTTTPQARLDESESLLRDLRGPRRDAALGRLHALLLRAARFEVARRRPALPHADRLRVVLVLEENRKVLLDHVT